MQVALCPKVLMSGLGCLHSQTLLVCFCHASEVCCTETSCCTLDRTHQLAEASLGRQKLVARQNSASQVGVGLTKVALVGVVAGQALHGTQIGLERLMSLLLQSLLQSQQSPS